MRLSSGESQLSARNPESGQGGVSRRRAAGMGPQVGGSRSTVFDWLARLLLLPLPGMPLLSLFPDILRTLCPSQMPSPPGSLAPAFQAGSDLSQP